MKTTPQSGFSLIELMVTVAVVAILMSVAVPQFQTLIEKNKVQALMDEFASGLYLARGEAAKRGYDVVLCAGNVANDGSDGGAVSTEKTDCNTTAADFSAGWIIFVDYNGNGLLDPATVLFDVNGDDVKDTPEEIVYASSVSSGGSYEVRSTGTGDMLWRLRYNANGLLVGGLLGAGFSIEKRGEATELAEVNINRTGRIHSGITH